MSNCRFCNAPLEHTMVDLGHQPPSNSFLTKEQLDEPETYYPLKVFVCDKCWLVQIPELKKAAEIFAGDYPYYSSQSPANVSHAKEFAEILINRFELGAHSRVLEIGSNDGYLLRWFREYGIKPLGIDPCTAACQIATKNYAVETDDKFWSAEEAKRRIPFDLICGINVLAHQPDINDFVEGLRIALEPNGVCVFEFPHLMHLVDGLQFDTIYAEHYSYFSLATICEIFEKHLLSIFDIEEIPEHGGSLRIYAEHSPSCRHSDKLRELLLREGASGMFTTEYYADVQARVDQIRSDFMRFLYQNDPFPGFIINGMPIPADGLPELYPGKMFYPAPLPPIFTPPKRSIAAYGAAAKGNTFLNFCGIRSDLIQFIVDRSPHKQGKFLPGSHIPVVSEETLKEKKPAYVLITAWNLEEEIMAQLSYIRDWGGKFVVAIPELEVL